MDYKIIIPSSIMFKKTDINLSFKNSPKNRSLEQDPFPDSVSSSENEKQLPKNSWSGYHVQFRNPRDFQNFAIDEKFNKWGDMVEYFKNQDRPYRLSQGSLKDLLYGTYKRKGMHSLSLNDLVTIRKINREKLTATKAKEEPVEHVNQLLLCH